VRAGRHFVAPTFADGRGFPTVRGMLLTNLVASWRSRGLMAAAHRRNCLGDPERTGGGADEAWRVSLAPALVFATTLLEAAMLAWGVIDVTGLRWWIAMLVGAPTAVALTLAQVRAWSAPIGSAALMRRHLGVSIVALLPAAVVATMTWFGGAAGPSYALCWLLPLASWVKQAAVAEAGLDNLAREVMKVRVQREVVAAARRAAEARLLRMQAQIQPEFVAETLDSLQSWVDMGDRRSMPVLRSLTACLHAVAHQVERETLNEVQLGMDGGSLV
jgi:hypothetical protein